MKVWIISQLMDKFSLLSAEIFNPLAFDMDQSPLTLAESKMLYARQREEIVICIP